MKELKAHIIILSGLIVVSVVLALTGTYQNTDKVDRGLFVVSDTAAVNEIIIQKANVDIRIKRNEKGWSLNDSLKVDPSLIKIFNAIMSQVEVVRPVSAINREEVRNDIQQKGQKVIVQSDDQTFTFYAGGNASKSQAYFADDDLKNIYLVHIRGYKNYLSGLFELTLNQWRDRILFASGWRTIQSLKIDYSEQSRQDLSIYFDEKFLKVDQVSAMDTTQLMNYLAQFEGFQVNDYLNPGQFPRYDSLSKTQPLAVLELLDIDKQKNRTLRFFEKINGQRFYLVMNEENQMIVVDEKRVTGLLESPNTFRSN